MIWLGDKIFVASSFLSDVRFSVDDGLVRVCVVRYVGSLRIMVVWVSIKGSG